jgi:hypothetical protein
LSWTDFSNNYESAGGKALQPLEGDREDQSNPAVEEIELEYEESNYDILY